MVSFCFIFLVIHFICILQELVYDRSEKKKSSPLSYVYHWAVAHVENVAIIKMQNHSFMHSLGFKYVLHFCYEREIILRGLKIQWWIFFHHTF